MSKRRKQWVDNCPGNARGRRKLKRADRQFMKMIIDQYGHDPCRVFIVPHPVQIDVLDLLPEPCTVGWRDGMVPPDVEIGPSWEEMRSEPLRPLRNDQRAPPALRHAFLQSTVSDHVLRLLARKDLPPMTVTHRVPPGQMMVQSMGSEFMARALQDIIARDIEEGEPKKSIWQQALQGVDDGYKPSPEEIAEMEAHDQRVICACGTDLENSPRYGCNAPWVHGDDVYK